MKPIHGFNDTGITPCIRFLREINNFLLLLLYIFASLPIPGMSFASLKVSIDSTIAIAIVEDLAPAKQQDTKDQNSR